MANGDSSGCSSQKKNILQVPDVSNHRWSFLYPILGDPMIGAARRCRLRSTNPMNLEHSRSTAPTGHGFNTVSPGKCPFKANPSGRVPYGGPQPRATVPTSPPRYQKSSAKGPSDEYLPSSRRPQPSPGSFDLEARWGGPTHHRGR